MALDPSITLSLMKQTPALARVQVQNEFRKSFQKIKTKMMAEFYAHPVTREIQAGAESNNISGTLGGVTNLYSFIGFEKGTDPIAAIEEILYKTDFTFSRVTNKSVEFSVYIPDPEEIFAVTPMPWAAGRSWAKGIESGISGLGYHLRTSRGSRSGKGIQAKNKVRGGAKFKNTQYITALINKYKKEFNNIQV